MADHARASLAIKAVHYAYPLLAFSYYLSAVAVSICTLQTISPKVKDQRVRRDVILGIMVVVVLAYVSEAIGLLVHSLVARDWYGPQHHIIYVLSSILVWGILVLSLLDTTFPVWFPYYGSWLIALTAEIVLAALPSSLHAPKLQFEYIQLTVQFSRVCLLLLLIVVFFGTGKEGNRRDSGSDEESQALLANGHTVEPGKPQNGNSYGSVPSSNGANTPETGEESSDDPDRERTKRMRKLQERLVNDGNWWTYAKSFSIFIPYVWPSGNKSLQLNLVLVGLCLTAGRFLNVLVPRQLGLATDALNTGRGGVPWVQVSLYVFYRWLSSSAGIGALRSYLWIPIEQYSYRAISTAAYNHIMNLSSDFHSDKKSGELYASITQGRSINGFIDDVCFDVLPMLIDLIVAFGYFYYLFDAYMALIVGVVTVVYLWTTTKLGAQQDQIRRDYRTNTRNESHVLHESMGSWTTVSYFNRIKHEESRYSSAIELQQKSERRWQINIYFLFGVQSLIFTLGLLAACFLAVYQVTRGVRPVGNFVTLLTYWAQLSGPLTFFANFYRRIAGKMLDAERLLELFQTKPSVKDKENAVGFLLGDGRVDFKNVNFSYDPRKPTIKNVSFHAAPGKTVALVGETGSGKSTILRLLFRFYDVCGGSIQIDGQDIRDVTLSSLRENMGVVPQDAQLFNETIMSNLCYAKLDATESEVHEACRAAAIHDKILSFPDGYDSKVGEHGVKLSGGELQRVAIARVILKNPKIIMLDEATSMVDTETEALIQEAFMALSRDRTTFVVAHRLSTTMSADLILVISDGEVVEQGTHNELLLSEGKYYKLWSMQVLARTPRAQPNGSEDPQITPTIINDLGQTGYQPPAEVVTPPQAPLQSSPKADRNFVRGIVSKAIAAAEGVLKPDAPEFIPKSLRKSVGDYAQASDGDTDGRGSVAKVPSTDRQKREKKQEKSEQKMGKRAQKQKPQKEVKPQGNVDGADEHAEDTSAMAGSPQQDSETLAFDASSKGEKEKRRRYRYRGLGPKGRKDRGSDAAGAHDAEEMDGYITTASATLLESEADLDGMRDNNSRSRNRRAKSKSAPEGQVDGADDSDSNNIPASVGSYPAVYQQRRASAPSDPPTGPKDMRGSSQGQRRRRPRHWRNKNKDGTKSTDVTASSSTETTSSQPPPTPLATPSNWACSGPSSQISVRFAPGF
ncbi:MAG: hypothetical protein M1839_006181 [Geoglossum umbratile]|nr:MAG: hypothetical protein M1839_006181 [Geoglossum umbratile]